MQRLKLSKKTGQGKHTLEERGPDLYETPLIAIETLCEVESLPKRIWEPACGSGNIVKYLRQRGHLVTATDLYDWKCPDSTVEDFLITDMRPACGAIVTNPPYQLAEGFVRMALQCTPQVYMLLRLAFLESLSRSDILDSGGLRRVAVFKRRLPMMHRHGWDGPKSTSAMAFAWFCWDIGHMGPATIDRI